MKKLFLLLLLAIPFVGCNSIKGTDTGPGSLKDVTYSVVMEPSSSGSPFVVKGEYIDENGKTIAVDQEAPFSVTVKNMPFAVKPHFEGYLFCIDTDKIVGTISVSATASESGNVIFFSYKDLELSKNTGYTSEEMKEATAFDIQML